MWVKDEKSWILRLLRCLYALYAIKARVSEQIISLVKSLARCAIAILDRIPESGPYTRAEDARKPGAPNSLARHEMGLYAV
jgi:hypothetical protein